MEIVELIAKNQYERGLTETRTKCMIDRTDSFARPYTEIHESEAVAWSRPSVTSFRQANANMKTDIGANRGSSLQTSHVKRNHLGNAETSHVKRNHLGIAQVERPPTKLFGKVITAPGVRLLVHLLSLIKSWMRILSNPHLYIR